MKISRLKEIVEGIRKTRILVLGDFFLDQYWSIDPALSEISLETNREAHQVVDVRLSPGAAGTVTNNLASLGVGTISALGCLGEDGNGFEVSQRLKKKGVRTADLILSPEIRTPTYTKPMFRDRDSASESEGDRFDIKNRSPLPKSIENQILERLERNFSRFDALAILDQVQERNSGVVTERVVSLVAELALRHPQVTVMADSRTRIKEFRNVLIKPNINEASRATGINGITDLHSLVKRMGEICHSRVLLTRGGKGIIAYDGQEISESPALPVSGPVDIVGAGDSVTAAAVSSLAAGATLSEASQVAVLASNVTIHKVGTTGTATREEILEKASKYQ